MIQNNYADSFDFQTDPEPTNRIRHVSLRGSRLDDGREDEDLLPRKKNHRNDDEHDGRPCCSCSHRGNGVIVGVVSGMSGAIIAAVALVYNGGKSVDNYENKAKLQLQGVDNYENAAKLQSQKSKEEFENAAKLQSLKSKEEFENAAKLQSQKSKEELEILRYTLGQQKGCNLSPASRPGRVGKLG